MSPGFLTLCRIIIQLSTLKYQNLYSLRGWRLEWPSLSTTLSPRLEFYGLLSQEILFLQSPDFSTLQTRGGQVGLVHSQCLPGFSRVVITLCATNHAFRNKNKSLAVNCHTCPVVSKARKGINVHSHHLDTLRIFWIQWLLSQMERWKKLSFVGILHA